MLNVREATFAKGETNVEFEDTCSECDADLTYTLNSQSLFFDFPDEDLIDRYWDGEKWEIDPTEYGLNEAPIVLYTPKLGKDEAIIDWATARAQAGQKIDENFIKFLIWMMPKPARASAIDAQIEKLHKEYKSWDVDKYEFMDDVIRNLTVDPSENLEATCPVCGQRTHSQVKFPNGIKALFKIESKIKKFGSR